MSSGDRTWEGEIWNGPGSRMRGRGEGQGKVEIELLADTISKETEVRAAQRALAGSGLERSQNRDSLNPGPPTPPAPCRLTRVKACMQASNSCLAPSAASRG